MSEAVDSPILLHSHVPKAAGQSLSQLFTANFGPLHLDHLHPDPFFVLSPETLQFLLDVNPWLKSISSHHLRAFPAQIGSRPALHVTFLREPRSAFISILKYVKQNFKTLSPEATAYWPADASTLSARELAARFLASLGSGATYDPVTRFFCSAHQMHACGRAASDPYGEVCLEVAESTLQRFLLVGIVEEAARSVQLLAAKTRRFGIGLNPKQLGRSNRTRVRESFDWLQPQDAVGSMFFRMTQNDQTLYDRFRRRSLDEYRALRRSGWTDVTLPPALAALPMVAAPPHPSGLGARLRRAASPLLFRKRAQSLS